jgi:hypothetical protein
VVGYDDAVDRMRYGLLDAYMETGRLEVLASSHRTEP